MSERKLQNATSFFIDADVTIPPDSIERIRSIFRDGERSRPLIGSYDEQPSEAIFIPNTRICSTIMFINTGAPCVDVWGACGATDARSFSRPEGSTQVTTDRASKTSSWVTGSKLPQKIRLRFQVKHLKRWNAYSLIETDVFDERHRGQQNSFGSFIRRRPLVRHDLNLGVSYRLSLITSFLFVAALVGALFTRWAVPFVLLFGFLFVLLQVPFFSFFRMKRGLSFAFRALAWRFGYDIYSGFGFCYGSLRFANSSTRKILGQAFAKLDAVALGAGAGTVWGGAIWAMTVLLLAKGGDSIGQNLALLGQFFPAYTVTWTGSLIGLLYGFSTGFVFGFAFARARNTAMRLHLGSRKVQIFYPLCHHKAVGRDLTLFRKCLPTRANM
jgi:hypothetical protein